MPEYTTQDILECELVMLDAIGGTGYCQAVKELSEKHPEHTKRLAEMVKSTREDTL